MTGISSTHSSNSYKDKNTSTQQITPIKNTKLGFPERVALSIFGNRAFIAILSVIFLIPVVLGIAADLFELIPKTKGMFSAVINNTEKTSVNQNIVFVFFVIGSACLLAMLTLVILGSIGKYRFNKSKENSTKKQQLDSARIDATSAHDTITAIPDARIDAPPAHDTITAIPDVKTTEVPNRKGTSFSKHLIATRDAFRNIDIMLKDATPKINQNLKMEDLLLGIVDSYKTLLPKELQHFPPPLPGNFTETDYINYDIAFRSLIEEFSKGIDEIKALEKDIDLCSQISEQDSELLLEKANKAVTNLEKALKKLNSFSKEHIDYSFNLIKSGHETRYLENVAELHQHVGLISTLERYAEGMEDDFRDIMSNYLLNLMSNVYSKEITAHDTIDAKIDTDAAHDAVDVTLNAGTSEVTNRKGMSFHQHLDKTQDVLTSIKSILENAEHEIKSNTFSDKDLDTLFRNIGAHHETLLSQESQHSSHSVLDSSEKFTMNDYLAYDPAFHFLIEEYYKNIDKIISDLKKIALSATTPEQALELSVKKVQKMLAPIEFNSIHIRVSFLAMEERDFANTRYPDENDFNLELVKNSIKTTEETRFKATKAILSFAFYYIDFVSKAGTEVRALAEDINETKALGKDIDPSYIQRLEQDKDLLPENVKEAFAAVNSKDFMKTLTATNDKDFMKALATVLGKDLMAILNSPSNADSIGIVEQKAKENVLHDIISDHPVELMPDISSKAITAHDTIDAKIEADTTHDAVDVTSNAETSEVTNRKGISFHQHLNKTQDVLTSIKSILKNAEHEIESNTFSDKDLDTLFRDIGAQYETLLSQEYQHSSHFVLDSSEKFTMNDYLAYDPAFHFLIEEYYKNIDKIIGDLKKIAQSAPTSKQALKLSHKKVQKMLFKMLVDPIEFNILHIMASFDAIRDRNFVANARYHDENDFNLELIKNSIKTTEKVTREAMDAISFFALFHRNINFTSKVDIEVRALAEDINETKALGKDIDPYIQRSEQDIESGHFIETRYPENRSDSHEHADSTGIVEQKAKENVLLGTTSNSLVKLMPDISSKAITAHDTIDAKIEADTTHDAVDVTPNAGTSEVINRKDMSFSQHLIATQTVLKKTKALLEEANFQTGKRTLNIESFKKLLLSIIDNYATLLPKESQHSSPHLPLPNESGNSSPNETLAEYLAYNPTFRLAIESAHRYVNNITSNMANINQSSTLAEQNMRSLTTKALRFVLTLSEFNQYHIELSNAAMEHGHSAKTRYPKDDFKETDHALVSTVLKEIKEEHDTILSLETLLIDSMFGTFSKASVTPSTQLSSSTAINDTEKNMGAENSRS